MDWQSLLHWVYVAGMTIGALHFWALSRDSRDSKGVPQYEYWVAIFIPIWSGLAYVAMALDQDKTEVAGQVVHYAGYGDWIVSTPLLLLTLSWTAMQFILLDLHDLRGLQNRQTETGFDRTANHVLHFLGNITAVWTLQAIHQRIRRIPGDM